ncbi:MAG TPA: hypothetical protein VLM38_10020, partial [Blastocatellia bacterium]|nr:hypothetical protein [Blastocatellia bacterium]
MCLAVVLNLVIWPSPKVTLAPLGIPSEELSNTLGAVASTLAQLRATPVVLIPSGPVLIPVPLFPVWPFQVSSPVARELSVAERTAVVSSITVSPNKLVGYIGDAVTFVAMGMDAQGRPAHGAKFTWASSDEGKLTVDDAGRATLVTPGLVIVTCSAGGAVKTAPVLIRPARRPVQTDQEWKADQDSLVGDGREPGEGGQGVLASLIDRLAPTAHAQGGQGADYGNAAAIGQVGTPPFAALEGTRLGPVMPGSNFELPISLVDLGGRGLATSLMAYYNSNSWGAYFDPVRNETVYMFDPIQSWPSPGFSLGFGRIVIYNGYYDPGLGDMVYSFMLVEGNGTRHSLGNGTASGNNILQTTDGSHIAYAGNALGGTVYYQDGTRMTISLVNNRRLPTQITDTNGNYIQIAYKWESNVPAIAINYIVDTLGRVIQFNYGGGQIPTSISTPAGTVTFSYQTVTMNYSFGLGNPVENAPASFYGISSISVPSRPTYNFTWSGWGMIYSVSAVSGGGTATVSYNYPTGGEELYFAPGFTQRTESPNAIYSYSGSGEITRPDGTKLTPGSGGGWSLKNASGQLLSSVGVGLTTDPGGSTAIGSVVTTDETGQQTKVEFVYDQYGNVVNKREYGFKISGAWQVRRRTHYSYVNWEPYISAYIRNRVTEVDVYDALQNTSDADDVLIGKSLYGYDSPLNGMEGYGGAANPPGHLSSYGTGFTTRGNLTNLTSYTDVGTGAYVTRSNKTDIFGGVTVAQLACCDQKSFTMTEATYWTKPSQTTSGDMSG